MDATAYQDQLRYPYPAKHPELLLVGSTERPKTKASSMALSAADALVERFDVEQPFSDFSAK